MTTGQSIFATVVGGVLVAIIVAVFSLENLRIPSLDGLGGTGNDGAVAAAPAATTAPAIDADCIISVTNSLAKYFEEPGFDQLEVGSVPTGRYGVSDSSVIDFAGKKERWFYIEANGQAGWILDNTFFVDSKEGSCT